MLKNTLELYLNGDTTVPPIRFPVKSIINAGYTGRDQAAVQAHIDELKAIGVPAPAKIPTYFPKAAALLTTDDGFEAIDRENTGEAEYVLLVAEDGVYVGVGSDHTDRGLEKTNIPKGKQMCPNFISRNVWRYEDVKAGWDGLQMRSWIGAGRETLFQETALDAFMTPEELMERVKKLLGGKLEPGTVIFSGTVSALIEGYPFSDHFECELLDPTTGKRLVCKYQIHLMDPLECF